MRDSKRDTDVQNSLLDSVGEGEGGMIWENVIETCIISYMKRIASPGSMHDIGCLGLMHCDDPTSNEYSGLISFRIDWFDILAVQSTLKNLL